MYYRRRYYKKKYKKKKLPPPSDLELLAYDWDKLFEALTSKTKKLICSSCSFKTDLTLISKREVYSGQYGIYIKCSGCFKNISVPTTIDIDRDFQLNKTIGDIDKFQKNLKKLNNKTIQEIFKIREKLIEESKIKQKKLDNELSKNKKERQKIWLERRDNCTISVLDMGFFREVAESFGLKNKEHKDMVAEGQSWEVKLGKEKYFTDLTNKIKEMDSYSKLLENKINLSYGWDDTKMNSNQKEMYNFMINFCYENSNFLNPNNNKDLEKIEEKHLKPLINKKEQRILLLRKIFKSTSGFIYVLKNESMPDFYKIGWTERTPEERAKELSGTGLPMPYRVAYSKSTNLTGEVEKIIHKKLDKFRYRSNREFFKIDLDTIKKTINDILIN